MIHHLFVDGAVVTVPNWGATAPYPDGIRGYSPEDKAAPWYCLHHSGKPKWLPMSREEMPKEFLVQLMLLGIPIRE